MPVFDTHDSFCLKAQELYQLVEGQNTTLCKLREMAHRNQLAQCKVRRGARITVQTLIQDHSLSMVRNLV